MNVKFGRIRLRRAVSAAFCMVIAMLLLQASPALMPKAQAADPKLQIEVKAGIGAGTSSIKYGRWFPVELTMTNAGESIVGDVAVQIANPNQTKDFSFVQRVELPQGSVKVVTLLLPGANYAKGNNEILFYEGSAQKGRKVALTGTTYLDTTALVKSELQIGVLSPDADTLNFLAVLSQNGKPLQLVHLSGKDMPESALGLDAFDVLVLNNFASDTLKEAQTGAILDWVKRGGTLLLAGGAGYAKTAAPFAAVSPVAVSGTVSVSELPKLAQTGEKELRLAEPFTLSQGKLAEGAAAILTENDGLPVFAYKNQGLGRVGYAAYDVSLNPLASWNGNQRLWERLLEADFKEAAIFGPNQMQYGLDPFWEMNNALEYFSELKPPRLGVLAWVLLAYSLVAGPLLYIALRRADRREWAWVIIPLLAVATSIGIYQFGAANRGQLLAQSLQTIELDGSGGGKKQTAMSVFLPKGGSKELLLPGGQKVGAYFNGDVSSGRNLSTESGQLLRQGSDESVVQIENLAYSSVSKFLLAAERLEPSGQFEVSLSLSAQGEAGQITNMTGRDIQDVGILTQQTYVQIGELKAGATSSFDTSAGLSIVNAYDISSTVFPYTGGSTEDVHAQHRALLLSYLYNQGWMSGMTGTTVLGWSREQSGLNIEGKSVPVNQLSLYAQQVPAVYESASGEVRIPSSALVPSIVENHLQLGSFTMQNGAYMQMGSGDFTFEYRLPEISGAAYQKMNIEAEQNTAVSLQIWNAQSEAWEDMELGQTSVYEGERLQAYLLGGSAVKMKAATIQTDIMFRFPQISMQGTVQR